MNVCNLLLLFCLPLPVRLCEREHTFPPQRPSALKPFVAVFFADLHRQTLTIGAIVVPTNRIIHGCTLHIVYVHRRFK